MHYKPVLAGRPIEELQEELRELFAPPSFRSKQVYEWICSGAGSFDEMSSLPTLMRKELSEKYSLFAGSVCSELHDPDGTIKLGIQMDDGAIIESVILTDGKGRKTACLSVQAGCPLGCVYCKTGIGTLTPWKLRASFCI